MLKAGEVHVWLVRLDGGTAALRRECSHQVLRAILEKETGMRLEFAVAEKGKPYLPGAPEVRFNLARSHELALVGVALGVDVGVDIERLRPLPEYAAIAERFFPPSEREVSGERDFFRRWTRIEAMLKALGVGLYGAGAELGGEWTVAGIDAGESFAAAVAAAGAGLRLIVHEFGADE
ncbi:MAG: 4'-phosphopantetheinyl transferase superfamily protein [Bryobacteraceae bacterium]